MCHGDLGPWNTIWRDGRPVAFIDWDFAEPAPALMDVGHMAFYSVPLRDDFHCFDCGFDEVPDRHRRLKALAEAYGIDDLDAIVAAAQNYLVENIRRMREFGPRGLKPWEGFVQRGFLEEDRERLHWLKENRGPSSPLTSYSSLEKRPQAPCRVIPRASPIFAQVTFLSRNS